VIVLATAAKIKEMTHNTAIVGWLLYRAGDTATIKNAYDRAIEAHEKFELDTSRFIEQNIGSVKFSCEELWAQQLTGMVPENKYFECDSCRLDLNDVPIGKFYLTNHDFDPITAGTAEDHYSKDIGEIVELMKTLYLATGASPLGAHVEPAGLADVISREDAPPFTAKSLARDRYEYLSWLTVFSPPVVKTYGRERLLEAPAYHVEELADDSILIVATEDPATSLSEYKHIADHIEIESY
jgi:hypothetical protein